MIRNTCKEMLSQRGYKINTDDPDVIIGRSDFNSIIVFTNPIQKFNIEKTKEYISIMNDFGINHSIIIYNESATPMAKKIISETPNNIKIELFHTSELEYNITKHKFACPHERLDKNAAKIFKKNYGLKHAILLSSDAVARFYNYSKGDVIMITRKDGYISWRIVR